MPSSDQIGAGAGGQGVGTGLRLAEAIRRDHFRGGQLRQIFLLLRFGAEQQQRQRADAGVRAPVRRQMSHRLQSARRRP